MTAGGVVHGYYHKVLTRLLLAALLLLASATPALAYIGPGAGFALVSSAFVLLGTIVIVFLTLLAWPFRVMWRAITGVRAAEGLDLAPDRRRSRRPGSQAHRSVHARGHPAQLQRACRERQLPPARRRRSRRCRRWRGRRSAPARIRRRHNIFDFLDRDRRTYLPMLSSASIGKVDRFLKLGRFRIPLRRARDPAAAQVETVLDDPRRARDLEHRPACADHVSARSVLRRRAERDVRARSAGQRRARSCSTRRDRSDDAFKEGGLRKSRVASTIRSTRRSKGPAIPSSTGEPPLTLPLRVRLDRQRRRAEVDDRFAAQSTLAPGVLSEWMPLAFARAAGHHGQRADAPAASSKWASTSRSTSRPSISIPKHRRCRSRIRRITRPISPRRSVRSRRSAWPKTPGRSTKVSPTTARF